MTTRLQIRSHPLRASGPGARSAAGSAGSASTADRGPVGRGLPWSRSLQYPTEAVVYALAVLCVTAALVLTAVAGRTHQQLVRIDAEAQQLHLLTGVETRLQELLGSELPAVLPEPPSVVAAIRADVAALRRTGLALRPATDEQLRHIEALLADPTALRPASLQDVSERLHQVTLDETAAHRASLAALRASATAEEGTAIGLLAAIGVLAIAAVWLLRRRVAASLADLSRMLDPLGAGDFGPIPVRHVHPTLRPLFESYNRLVRHLEQLEREHDERTAGLRSEVRAAAGALLEQQRALARAERVAAVGETTASLAHQIRNPLAGVQMSLANLRREVAEPELAERLDLAIREIGRLTHLMNQQLSAAGHVPEAARCVALDRLVEELLMLLRYQVPEAIRLEARVEEGLAGALPRDRLRQALVQLVRNAVGALDGGPGTVTVAARRDGDHLEIRVEDDGPGFPADVLASGPDRAFGQVGGTGLGLAVARRLALELGGELALENHEPRGARVRLRLPLREATRRSHRGR